MTNVIRYLTHPQVSIDPSIPVPCWGLSEVGKARTEALTVAGGLSRYHAGRLQRRAKGDRDR